MLAPSKRWFTDSFNSGASARIIFPMNLQAIQAALREAAVDGWLFYDHHHRDPIAAHFLGLDPKANITRRWYYFIPATGEPRKLLHRLAQPRRRAHPRPHPGPRPQGPRPPPLVLLDLRHRRAAQPRPSHGAVPPRLAPRQQ